MTKNLKENSGICKMCRGFILQFQPKNHIVLFCLSLFSISSSLSIVSLLQTRGQQSWVKNHGWWHKGYDQGGSF